MSRQGVRAGWDSVPADIRRRVEEIAGAAVVAATNLHGGFSPGPAARCELADGRTVFVKACGLGLNPITPTMHRREAIALASLPTSAPAPRLLGVADDGDWVAVVIQWVDGRMPHASLDPGDANRLIRLVERLADVRGDPATLEPIMQVHPELGGNWQQLLDAPLDGMDRWTLLHLEQLADIERDVATAVHGDRLAHVDIRTDNVIFSHHDEVHDVFVDWPGASIGAPWCDLVCLLPSLELDGGPSCSDAFARSTVAQNAPPDGVDSVLAALAGYFTRSSLMPPPPGLPTLRAFQAAQGAIARRWLGERRGWAVSWNR